MCSFEIKHFQSITVKSFLFTLIVAFSSVQSGVSQNPFPVWPDSIFSAYYHQRAGLFNVMSGTKGGVYFVGNSITDGAEWSEIFGDANIRNRGISADISAGVLNRIQTLIERRPDKVFLMIGINDLARGIAPDSILHNIGTFVRLLREYSPTTQIFFQSLLPVNPDLKMFAQHTSKAAEIKYVNGILEREAGQGYAYIDLHTHFLDEDGKLSRRWTNDGLHLNGDGYMLWKHIVFPLVYDLQAHPAIIPQPLDISWLEGSFPLYKLKNITIPRSGLDNEAVILKDFLGSLGLYPRIIPTGSPEGPVIVLNLDPAYDGPSQEAYSIMVSPQRVEIRAKGAHGILHGIQTLKQLCRDGVMVPCCIIKDAPAFQWRGFMIDVGRNYVSPDILKQIIDKMSFYKFNIFHFHPTEDIAWRLESRLYPQLTAPEYMLRDKGLYYTVAEVKSLIEFCRARHITFVPEIDMPGHSAAFRRAMGVDMQSDSGTVLVKKIIGELIDDYPLQYIHVGGDEVKIENKDFLPDIVAMIQGRGLRTIAWSPGGETNSHTMRQLWMDDDGHNNKAGELMYIDSRHLYLNHMDPLEAVTTIYYRKIGERTRGDTAFPGATLCLWNDRAVADGSDILSMNPVYPGMMAFAERVWNGGGRSGWIAGIPLDDVPVFSKFESGLLDHKALYFNNLPFPYVRQSNLRWTLIGPYANGGDFSIRFEPEISGKPGTGRMIPAVGGTIVFRHWWAPQISGALQNPEENTTWYATTTIQSDVDTVRGFWIGFNDLSRSPATDSPPLGGWNHRQGKLWVNGHEVPPPIWRHPGQQGNSEIPLVDEGYSYRPPTMIHLKKGANTVLVKSPIGKFRGKDWQNPEKWMFTFVPVQ